ncbi:arginyl-tRNA--protein transferase 1 isoform X1 [Euwallacea fornicatus]|uniref:arginyl-tRNA--protein transferase 1 isoform X1 n=1 Tax=Euwallacea fornicatus TaxID=995702 RepID=UPI0033900635
MSVDLSKFSIAQWYAERERHRCGYCKNPSGSISYGMYTEELTVQDYKDLIDRGWRRSGKYCYKPIMNKTCCPQYTIRCDATNFKLNNSHKRIIKKFNKFLNSGIFTKNNVQNTEDDNTESLLVPGYDKQSSIKLDRSVTAENCSLSADSDPKLSTTDSYPMQTSKKSAVVATETKQENSSNVLSASKSIKKQFKKGSGADPNKLPPKKAKLMRLEKKKEKLLQKGLELQPYTTNNANNKVKTLKEFLEEIPCSTKHKIKPELICPTNCKDKWDGVKNTEYELYAKYQKIVHNDLPENLSFSRFTRFLVSSPLKAEPFPNGVDGPGYGSFHQQYWLDDKLIAVGVIDILPGCVSSVYFFYDPDYRVLTLGTYGSLREIQLVQDLQPKIPDLKYYYMGFYIHSCPKMRYKGKLHSSVLLCPETYCWFPIEKCLDKLDANKYSRLNDDIDALDGNKCDSTDVDHIKVVQDYKLMYAKDFVRLFDGDRAQFVNISDLVGKKSLHNIVFWL